MTFLVETIMNKIQFASNNIKAILISADLTVLRLVLSVAAFGSAIWFGIMLMYGMSITDIELTRRLMFEVFTISEWTVLILVYGILNILLCRLSLNIKLKERDR